MRWRSGVGRRWAIARIALSFGLAVFAGVPGRAAIAADEVDTSDATATEKAFREGLEKYDAHDYSSAIELFERAYRESPSPTLLFNIAQAWRRLGNCTQARAFYRQFVDAAPESPDRARAEDRLRALGPCEMASAHVTTVPPPRKIAAPPTLVSNVPQAPASAPRRHYLAAGIFFSASAALAGAAAISAWHAKESSEYVSALFETGGTWDGSAEQVQREGQRARLEAIVFASTAVVTALVGAVLFHWKG